MPTSEANGWKTKVTLGQISSVFGSSSGRPYPVERWSKPMGPLGRTLAKENAGSESFQCRTKIQGIVSSSNSETLDGNRADFPPRLELIDDFSTLNTWVSCMKHR